MKFFLDDCEHRVRVRWYFVENTDFIQNNAFVSSKFDEVQPDDGVPVGEVGDLHRWVDGSVPPEALSGTEPCGTPAQWAGQIFLSDGQYTPCGSCSWEGHGCACTHGHGSFYRDQLSGLGCSCTHGGGKTGPGAIWRGMGCSCSLGRPTTYSCGCGRSRAILRTSSRYNANSCGCGRTRAIQKTRAVYKANSCGCGTTYAIQLPPSGETLTSCGCGLTGAVERTTAKFVASSCGCGSTTAVERSAGTVIASSCGCGSTTAVERSAGTVIVRSCGCAISDLVQEGGFTASGGIGVGGSAIFHEGPLLTASGGIGVGGSATFHEGPLLKASGGIGVGGAGVFTPLFVTGGTQLAPLGTSLAVSRPGASKAGDVILICSRYASGTTGVTPPAGFTALPKVNVPGPGPLIQAFWKIDSGSEPATYTFTYASSSPTFCTARYTSIVTGVEANSTNTGTSATAATATLTTLGPGRLLVVMYSSISTASLISPWVHIQGGSTFLIGEASRTWSPKGASGAINYLTYTGSTAYANICVAIY